MEETIFMVVCSVMIIVLSNYILLEGFKELRKKELNLSKEEIKK